MLLRSLVEDVNMGVLELKSGLTVVHHEMPYMNSIGVSLYFRAGAHFEKEAHAGISHLAEHLLLDGTKTHPTNYDLVGPIEAVGGFLNGSTDREYVRVFGMIPARHSHLLLRRIGEILTEPALTEAKLAREKNVVANEIEERTEDLKVTLDDLLYQAIWGSNSLGRSIGGSLDSLGRIDLSVMKGFLLKHIHARNAVVSVAGRISRVKLRRSLEEFPRMQSRELPRPIASPECRCHSSTLHVKTRDVRQTYLGLGFVGVPWKSPTKYPLFVINELLANSMSSRLYQRVRIKEGLAYHIWSRVRFFSDTGRIGIFFITDDMTTLATLKTVVEEIRRLVEGNLDARELEEAKERHIGQLELMYEDTLELSLIGGKAGLYRDSSSLEEICREVREVSLSDISSLASQILTKDNMHVALICHPEVQDKEDHILHILGGML